MNDEPMFMNVAASELLPGDVMYADSHGIDWRYALLLSRIDSNFEQVRCYWLLVGHDCNVRLREALVAKHHVVKIFKR